MTTSTNHPAAFINALAEEGTKEEAIQFLQKTWNELCELRREHDIVLGVYGQLLEVASGLTRQQCST